MKPLINRLKLLLKQQGPKSSTPSKLVISLRKELDKANERLEVMKKYGTNIKKWPTEDLFKELFERLRRWF